ncbi:hypothetical protein T11_16761 [Trichinella zimbabwensis]|uniref:Uncharacterized protein n=1 Tax=Trichinella zimbabwensis TaxID=268475 RepID=A0A0V1GSU2_9BILA|nr:hypothetical protein T11_16761 [Trichinella zimbabwensis]
MKSNYTPCYQVLRPISRQIRFYATCDQDFRKFRNFIGY